MLLVVVHAYILVLVVLQTQSGIYVAYYRYYYKQQLFWIIFKYIHIDLAMELETAGLLH